MSQLVLIGLVLMAALVIGVVGDQQERRRRAAIAAWAASRRWSDVERSDRGAVAPPPLVPGRPA